MSSLQQALPHPVDPPTEQAFLDCLRHHFTFAVRGYVDLLRAVEAEFGPEGLARVRQRYEEAYVARLAAWGANAPDRSLRAYCAALDSSCIGSHDWEKVEETDTRQAYRYTRCVVADAFRSLGAADIGLWGCELDERTAPAFNPDIKLHRTKTLMAGDDCCDHVYYTEPE